MHPLRLAALIAPALVLALGCEDSDSPSPGVFSPEAGPGFEAGPLPEAGPIAEGGADAAVDSFVPPVLLGVTITVLEGGAPKKDARVILHDATGAVTGDQLTDAAGKITIATAPSMLTVLSRSDSDPQSRVAPVTFVGVADGDKLVVTIPSYDVLPVVGKLSVSFQAGAAETGATSFLVSAGSCNVSAASIASAVMLDLRSSCITPQLAVFANAYSASNGGIAFGYAKNIAAPALNATVNVGPIAFAAPGTTTLTATNIPADATEHTVDLYAIANGGGVWMGEPTGTFASGGFTFKTATGFADAYQTFVEARKATAGESAKAFVRREATNAPASATLAFDFSTALPFITNTSLVKPTPARPDVTLTTEASLAASSGGIVTLAWFANGDGGQWTFVLPPSTTAFKVPAIPADAAAFLPGATVKVESAAFASATNAPAYADFKKLPMRPGFGHDLIEYDRPLPAAATVKITSWSATAE